MHGFNTNQNAVQSEILCKTVPIVHQQGKEHSCLSSLLASAFAHMQCKCVVQHIVVNQKKLIGKDPNIQWMGLCTLLEQKQHVHEEMHFEVHNHTQGSKHKPRHTLDVEFLTPDHEDALNLHSVLLVGANGKQDHAVAVVDNKIFDSSTADAVDLCWEALDWCCNCNGGYGKTGKTMRITIKRCKFEAKCRARVSAPTAADWLRAGYTDDITKERMEAVVIKL